MPPMLACWPSLMRHVAKHKSCREKPWKWVWRKWMLIKVRSDALFEKKLKEVCVRPPTRLPLVKFE